MFCHKLGSKRRFVFFWGRKRPPGESYHTGCQVLSLATSIISMAQGHRGCAMSRQLVTPLRRRFVWLSVGPFGCFAGLLPVLSVFFSRFVFFVFLRPLACLHRIPASESREGRSRFLLFSSSCGILPLIVFFFFLGSAGAGVSLSVLLFLFPLQSGVAVGSPPQLVLNLAPLSSFFCSPPPRRSRLCDGTVVS